MEEDSLIARDDVYSPSEDTYLLLDSLEKGDGFAIDVGTGIGIIGIELAKKGWDVISTDINYSAIKNALENVKKEEVMEQIQCLSADLLKFLKKDLQLI